MMVLLSSFLPPLCVCVFVSHLSQYDTDGDGKLSTTELSRLCKALGSRLTHSELEAAVTALDLNRNGYVEEEEFLRWWRGGTDPSGGLSMNV